ELPEEDEVHAADGAVTLLGDDKLHRDGAGSHAAVPLLIPGVLAVDEHHHVGVLLDGAGLTQVREHGLATLALLDLSAELAEREHRHLQLLGELLERTGDLRDLELPALRAVLH